MHYAISAHNLKKYYNRGKENEVRALDGVSFEVAQGDLVAIIGPSGSGKSTLMHILGVLDRPQSGTLSIGGVRIDTLRRRQLPRIRAQEVGFVFQGFNLLSTLSAVENVAEPGLYNGMSRREALDRAEMLMEQVGLSDRLDNFPNQLSGGQQQRVAIARALMNQPSILLGDEPTGELDTVNAAKIMDLLIELNRVGQTIVIVTHNLEVAERCRTIVRMRDGTIESIDRRS
jgi:putative ABC transport system ATP-binding protein